MFVCKAAEAVESCDLGSTVCFAGRSIRSGKKFTRGWVYRFLCMKMCSIHIFHTHLANESPTVGFNGGRVDYILCCD